MPSSGDVVFAIDNESQGKLISGRRKFQELNSRPEEQTLEGDQALKIKFANRREKSRFYSGNKEYVREKYEKAEEEMEKVSSFFFILNKAFCSQKKNFLISLSSKRKKNIYP